jgi:hypothetical protein
MNYCKGRALTCLLVLLSSGMFSPSLHAQNKVLGEVELVGASKVENTSGVWIDGQYVGYLHELKGAKKLLLLPGEHDITVKQGGYLDFVQNVSVRAGEKQTIGVKMEKDTRVTLPTITAEIKLEVKPNRAAVFVDGVFIGHISEFEGPGKALLVAPGKHKIKISLPGYHTLQSVIRFSLGIMAQNGCETLCGGSPGSTSCRTIDIASRRDAELLP